MQLQHQRATTVKLLLDLMTRGFSISPHPLAKATRVKESEKLAEPSRNITRRLQNANIHRLNADVELRVSVVCSRLARLLATPRKKALAPFAHRPPRLRSHALWLARRSSCWLLLRRL